MVLVAGKYLLHRAVLYDLTRIHNSHQIAGLCHDTQIVCDHNHGGIQLFLQFHHHCQHLRLDRHVQRSSRLVGNQQQARAMAMTTRCFMPPENWWG